MKMKSKCLQWATKELSMRIVLKDTNPLPAKKAATSSLASKQSGTRVPKGRGGRDLPKISAFPANTPNFRGRGSSQEDKTPAQAPRFSTNTGEGYQSSAQGGRNCGAINRHPPLKPPGTIKTATKDKTKSKEKNTSPKLVPEMETGDDKIWGICQQDERIFESRYCQNLQRLSCMEYKKPWS